ncbi:hypothetical protein BC829DRAFT_395197 [Chytridium lagenaria]|nr:hypothetical protein BC829DRAFT_395197 [Chytridium lagenaria]
MLVLEENFQYIMLNLWFLAGEPLALVLVPYVTFSLFHILTYSPLFPPSDPLHTIFQTQISPAINTFTTTYQIKALEYITYLEVWILPPYLILAIFRWKIGFMTLSRYQHSDVTKKAVTELKAATDKVVLGSEAVPVWLKTGYRDTVKFVTGMLVAFDGSIQQARPQ